MTFQTLYIGAQSEFYTQIVVYLFFIIVGFVICLYIFRAIFNIPSFLRYQKAQIRLLEEIAKRQGVDSKRVQSIVSETYGWEGAPAQPAQSETSEQ